MPVLCVVVEEKGVFVAGLTNQTFYVKCPDCYRAELHDLGGSHGNDAVDKVTNRC